MVNSMNSLAALTFCSVNVFDHFSKASLNTLAKLSKPWNHHMQNYQLYQTMQLPPQNQSFREESSNGCDLSVKVTQNVFQIFFPSLDTKVKFIHYSQENTDNIFNPQLFSCKLRKTILETKDKNLLNSWFLTYKIINDTALYHLVHKSKGHEAKFTMPLLKVEEKKIFTSNSHYNFAFAHESQRKIVVACLSIFREFGFISMISVLPPAINVSTFYLPFKYKKICQLEIDNNDLYILTSNKNTQLKLLRYNINNIHSFKVFSLSLKHLNKTNNQSYELFFTEKKVIVISNFAITYFDKKKHSVKSTYFEKNAITKFCEFNNGKILLQILTPKFFKYTIIDVNRSCEWNLEFQKNRFIRQAKLIDDIEGLAILEKNQLSIYGFDGSIKCKKVIDSKMNVKVIRKDTLVLTHESELILYSEKFNLKKLMETRLQKE